MAIRHLLPKAISALAAWLLFTMCADDGPELSDVAVLISPDADVPVSLYSGEQALYKVNLTTANSYVASLQITSFNPQHGLTQCADVSCGKKEFTYQFSYTAPELDRNECEVTLTFTATDNEGNQASVVRKLTVTNRALTIAEKTGVVLYSPASGLPDALSLADVAHPFSLADSPDPELADVYVDTVTGFNNITWRSNTRTKFLRHNNFNYGGATASGITSVFKNSVRTDYVPDIQPNDIILVGHGDVAEGVFYVVNVLRGGASPDCMQLNFKGVVSSDAQEPTEEQPTE